MKYTVHTYHSTHFLTENRMYTVKEKCAEKERWSES